MLSDTVTQEKTEPEEDNEKEERDDDDPKPEALESPDSRTVVEADRCSWTHVCVDLGIDSFKLASEIHQGSTRIFSKKYYVTSSQSEF